MATSTRRRLAADGKHYFSYAQIAENVASCVPRVKKFSPDVIVAIGGGGFIPARMLRTHIRVPVIAISLELYDDRTDTATAAVQKKQWFSEDFGPGALVRGGRVLVVDEVDDTRATLQYAVEELIETNAPAAVATMVVHNKVKPKTGELPDGVTYIAGEEIPDGWICYPWEAAAGIRDHERLAAECAGEAVATGSSGVTFAVGVGMGFLAEALYRRVFDTSQSM